MESGTAPAVKKVRLSGISRGQREGRRFNLRLLLLAILLLAAILRFYRLDAQSFWNDEGNSARIAERTPGLILEGAEGDIHPPGYYLLLHYWRALFGHSEFALRSLSVGAGLALVVFTYLLGRHLFGEPTGLVAAFLGAISPFAVYYSQEARMYALLAALSAASTYLLLHLLSSSVGQKPGLSEKTWFLAYVLTSAAGLYTQYAFPFILLVHNGFFGLWWLAVARRSAHRWRGLTLWAGAQAAVVALYLPWLPIALRSVTGWSSAGRAYELGPALLDVLRILSAGITLPVGEATAQLAGAGLLLLVGLLPTLPFLRVARESPTVGHRQADRAGWFGLASVTLYLLLPVVLIFAFDLYKPAWLKFLMVVLPPFHLLLAHGIETLAQLLILHSPFSILHPPFSTPHSPLSILRSPLPIRILAIAFLVITSIPPLHNLYFNPAYARDDYRQIAADVAALARPGDGVILNAPNQWEVFTYYYPDQDVYPAPYRPGAAKVETFLSPLVEQQRRLFVLYWGDAESDPQRLIETWLAAHAYRAGDRWYGRVHLATYGVASLPEEPAAALDVRFGESIHLRGHTLVGDWFAPGDILPLTLFWETQAPVAERYKVTVQLLDRAGQLVAQHDTEPGDSLNPTTTWDPGQVLADRYGLPLPPDLPPDRYTLIAGLYHVATGERLLIATGEDHVVLGDVQVRPSVSYLPPDLPNATYQRLQTMLRFTPTPPPTSTCCTNWSGLYYNVREFFQDTVSTWVLTEVGLLRFDLDGKLLAFYTRPGHAPLDWGMHVMAPDGSGGVWVGSDDGMWWLHDRQWAHLLSTDRPICHTAVDVNGELWADTVERPELYYQMYGGSGDGCMHFNRSPGHAGPLPPTFTVLYHYSGNGAWESWSGLVGNTNVPAPVSLRDYCHLWTWVSPASICGDEAPPAPPLSDVQHWLEESDLPLLPPSSLKSIHAAVTIDSQGSVWIGKPVSGELLTFEQGRWYEVEAQDQTEEQRSALCSSACTLWPDAEGSLWAGSARGVCRWNDGRVTMSADLGAVASLVQDWEDRIWAGQVQKGVARLDGDTWTRFDVASGALPSDLVTCMAVDTVRQRLYVGTYGGLATFDGREWSSLRTPIAARPMWINALAVGDDGDVWVGTYSGPTRDGQFAGTLLHYVHGEWEHVPLPAQAAVGALLVDRAGRLWVGLIPGGFSGYGTFHPWRGPLDTPPVWSYHDGEWRPVGSAQGLGAAAVFGLAEGRDGTIWVAGAICVSTITPADVWEGR
jgi:mannosyltransferase